MSGTCQKWEKLGKIGKHWEKLRKIGKYKKKKRKIGKNWENWETLGWEPIFANLIVKEKLGNWIF